MVYVNVLIISRFISTLIIKIKYNVKGIMLADIHAQAQSVDVSVILCLYFGKIKIHRIK